MKVRDSGVRGEEFLGSRSSFEAELSTFLLPGRSMRLFHEVVAAGGRDDLDVLRSAEHGEFPRGRPVAPQLIGVDDLWDVVLAQQADEKGLGRFSITVFLEEDVQHVPTFVNCPPQPVLHLGWPQKLDDFE